MRFTGEAYSMLVRKTSSHDIVLLGSLLKTRDDILEKVDWSVGWRLLGDKARAENPLVSEASETS